MTLPESLAALNALLNATAATLIFIAWRVIKSQRADRIQLHRRLMLTAVTLSAVFLVSYVTRYVIAGDTPFLGEGAMRIVYFSILISHVSLAVTVLPLVLRTLFLGRSGRYPEHRKIARVAFPIWMYVSITGVLVYFLLYQY